MVSPQCPKVLKDLIENYGEQITKQIPALKLSSHSLSRFPGELTRCSGLQQLDLSDNKLSTLPAAEILTSLPVLQELNLADNYFQSFELLGVEELGQLPKLAKLDLRRNPLKCINQRLELIAILLFRGAIPSGDRSGWLPRQASVVKQSRGLVKTAVKDPKVITSVKTNVGAHPNEGPVAASKRLSTSLGKTVHYCDMNVAPVPRTTGRFVHLTELNGVSLSIENLDATVENLNSHNWYATYPRIQCQKQLKCSVPLDPEAKLERLHASEKRQADADLKRFHNRLVKPERLPKSSLKKAGGTKGSMVQRLAARRDKTLQAKAAKEKKHAEHKVTGSIEALLKFGNLDGGLESEVDKVWVNVRDSDEEGSDQEMSSDQADQLLETLRFKALSREQAPNDDTEPRDGPVKDNGNDSPEDALSAQQGQSMMFLTKAPDELTLAEAAQRELADSQNLVTQYREEHPDTYFKPYLGLTYNDYAPLLVEDYDSSETRVSEAAAERKASLEAAVASRVKKGWDKKPVSFHELIVQQYRKQRIENDQTLDKLGDKIQVYYDEKRQASTWENDLSAKTTAEVKMGEYELQAECDVRFQAKPVNLRKELASCHLAGKHAALSANSATVESEMEKQRYKDHRSRLQAIKSGILPACLPDATPGAWKPSISAPQPAKKAEITTGQRHQIDVLPSGPKGWDLASLQRPGDENISYTQLLQTSIEVRKSVVDDLRSLKYKTKNFKAEAREVEGKLEDDFYMMTQYFASKETAIEDQKLMIGDSEFSFSNAFRNAQNDAEKTKRIMTATMRGGHK